jgi:hypothetical protein
LVKQITDYEISIISQSLNLLISISVYFRASACNFAACVGSPMCMVSYACSEVLNGPYTFVPVPVALVVDGVG